MPSSRFSGLLLHPTSLPGRFGIGDLGEAAFKFVDFLQASGQQLWQVLPLGPPGYGNSPYMCYSSLAGNPLLISLEQMQQAGWLSDADLETVPDFNHDRVEFEQVEAFKMEQFRRAWQNFCATATPEQQDAFAEFCTAKAEWLDDYALFMALKESHQESAWHTWPKELAWRSPEALSKWREQNSNSVRFRKFLQFLFFSQWSALKDYANSKGIQIVGDIPIYVAHDSADVWANPENFHLNPETGEPSLIAGVPPDYFSATGQLWGNPVYNWDHLKESEFHWWVQRFRAMLDLVDLIRIDHFRGFEAYWAVPQGAENAIGGEWIKAPGEAFFQMLNQKLGHLPILAEDLGLITPEVNALRDQFGFPGMKVLQFAFGSDRENPYLPYNYDRNCVVYTGTHDNDTTIGWFNQLSEAEQAAVLRYLNSATDQDLHWQLIGLALASVAGWVIIPLQDVLGLDSSARMNVPSFPEGNWGWRFRLEMLTDQARDRLYSLTETYGRTPIAASSD